MLRVLGVLFVSLLFTGCVVRSIEETGAGQRSYTQISDDNQLCDQVGWEIDQAIGNEAASAIDEQCYYGQAYLVGTYLSESDKDKAIMRAKNVPGVKGVNAFLNKYSEYNQCVYGKGLSEAAPIKDTIVKALGYQSGSITVYSVQCHIVLLGVVPTEEDIIKAIKLTKKQTGVRTVNSYLMTPQ